MAGRSEWRKNGASGMIVKGTVAFPESVGETQLCGRHGESLIPTKLKRSTAPR